MSASTDVPVTIIPEAEGRIEELGLRKELKQMIERLREVVPGLAAIGVTIAECYDSREEPGVRITAYSDRLFGTDESASDQIDRWIVRTFPPPVLEHLCILFSPGNPNAR